MRTIEKIFQDEVGTGYPLEDILNNLSSTEIREIIQVCQKEPLMELKEYLDVLVPKLKIINSLSNMGSRQTIGSILNIIKKITKEIDYEDTTKTR